MADDLYFSVSNILSSHFPRQRVLRIEPLRERVQMPWSFQPRQRISGCRSQANVFVRGDIACDQALDNDDIQVPGCINERKQMQYVSREEKKKGHNYVDRKKPEDTKNIQKTAKEKGAGKTKRNRVHFTRRQIAYLEDVFSRQKYLTRDERALLASVLYMTKLQIRNWFQNRRYQLRRRVTRTS